MSEFVSREVLVKDRLTYWVGRADQARTAWEYAVNQANMCITELEGSGVIEPERPKLTVILGGLSIGGQPNDAA